MKYKYDVKVICVVCNTKFERPKYIKSIPCCSWKCRGKHRQLLHLPMKRILFQEGKLKYRRRIRIHLLERDGYICQICKNTIWYNNPIPLQVDHIDGNASNNNPNNLRLICHNCDACLPTFAGKNRGNGRGSHGLKIYD